MEPNALLNSKISGVIGICPRIVTTVTYKSMLSGWRAGADAEVVAVMRRLAATDPEKYKATKKLKQGDEGYVKIPAYCLSGEFSYRRDECLKRHSNVLQIDGDEVGREGALEVIEALKSDPHILFAGLSLSGHGVKAGAHIDGSRHLESFFAAESHYSRLGLRIDNKLKDPSRICFTTHDPGLYIAHETPQVLPITDEAVAAAQAYRGDHGELSAKADKQTEGVTEVEEVPSEHLALILRGLKPQRKGANHGYAFSLKRRIECYGREFKVTLTPGKVRYIWERWYQTAQAASVLNPELSKGDYWDEFNSQGEVAKPLGTLYNTPLDRVWLGIVSANGHSVYPKAADQFEGLSRKRLVALCHGLQKAAGESPFYLSCRDVQHLLGLPDHNQGARMLRQLVSKKILAVATVGSAQTMKATRYNYIA